MRRNCELFWHSPFIWHDKTPKYKNLLGKVGEAILLPSNCESTHVRAIFGIVEIFVSQ
jgi:hypothetical protein